MGQVWGIGKRRFRGDWGKRVWLFDALVWTVMGYGVKVWGWKEREGLERMQEKYLKWLLGVEWGTPGYMIREELQRDKVKTRAGRRAWTFEGRLAEGKGSALARKCWEEMRERMERGKEISAWERERQDFFRERGIEGNEWEKWRQGTGEEWRRMEEKEKKLQREERWEKIKCSRYNKWYWRVKKEGIPKYLKKGWEENRWLRIARYRLGGGVRERRYWWREEDRLCRVCEGGVETWEHVWEECGRWGAVGSWQEMVEVIMGEEGEGEKWIRELERFREGGWREERGEGGMEEGVKERE